MRNMIGLQLKNIMDEINTLNGEIDDIQAGEFLHPYDEEVVRDKLAQLDKLEREKDIIERSLRKIEQRNKEGR
jgi:hypothetical protein